MVLLNSVMPKARAALWGLLLTAALFWVAGKNYLLFHTVAEGFSIVVAALVYILANRTYRYSGDNYLLFVGNSYFFVAIILFFHVITYYGMNIFPAPDRNTPTQLWIAGRFVESLSLFMAPFFVGRVFPRTIFLMAYTSVTGILIASIMWLGLFPTCFADGEGLTTFKIVSEYIISLIIAGAMLKLYLIREQLNRPVYLIMMVSMAAAVLTELSFTLYTDVYGIMNFTGHLLKIVSYYLIYRGIVLTGMDSPYDTIFNDLTKERDFTSAVLDTAGALVVVLDTRGRIIRFNRACELTTGYSFDEVRGRYVGDLFLVPGEAEAVKLIFDNLLISGVPKELINYWITKNGEHRLVKWSNTLLTDDKGGVEYIIATGIDITEQKQAEEAFRWEHEVNSAIAELSGKLLQKATIEEMSDLVLDYAKHLTGSAFGYVGYIEPKNNYLVACTMTRDIWDVCRVEEKDIVFKESGGLVGWVLNNRKSILTNEPDKDPRSSGTPAGHIPVQRFLSAPAMIGETLVGQIALVNAGRDYNQQDLSFVERLAAIYAIAIQRGMVEEELAETNRRLEEADRLKDEFLANTNHELKSPLTAIIAFTELLLDRGTGTLNPLQYDYINEINDSSKDLLSRVNELRDLSRIKAGKLTLHIEPVNIGEVVAGMARRITPEFERKGVALETRCPVTLFPAAGDKERLGQVLTNLLSNALKFTPAGGKVLIEAQQDLADGKMIISVEDNGIGIDVSEHGAIFNMFYQVDGKNSRTYGGTGIGLTLVKSLVEMHGGSVGLDSCTGRGSRFTFSVSLHPSYTCSSDLKSCTTLS